MSRESLYRHRDSPNRSSSRHRRNSDEFVEEFSRLLVARDQEFNASQDRKIAEIQDAHTRQLEESIHFHEAQRAHAVNELESYRQKQLLARQDELRQAQQLHLKQAEQARRNEEQRQATEKLEAERALEAERQRQEHEKTVKETRERTELLKRQNELAKAENKLPAANGNPQSHLANTSTTTTPQASPAKLVPALEASSAPSTSIGQTPPSRPSNSQSESSQTTTTQPGVSLPIQQKDAVHQKYLNLHKRLKKLRSDVKKGGPSLKEWTNKRLVLKKAFGQLASESDPEATEMERKKVRAANLQRRKEIISTLQAAISAPGPTVDVRDYIINPQSDLSRLDTASAQIPAIYIYLINMAAKAGVNTIKSTEPPVVEVVGITLAFVLGSIDLRFHGESFVDILLAKYHFVSPILFGIYGSETTERGRLRLGWPHDMEGNKILWIDEKTYFEEQQYLAVGWAALTLRDFAKAKTSRNACPPWNYWASVASIVNTPPEGVTRVHFVVLKSMLQNHADKFIKFYGRAATVALRTAIVEFPRKQGAKTSTERAGVEYLQDGLSKKFGIVL